jgi:hypothetical protein
MKEQEIWFEVTTPCCDGYCSDRHYIGIEIKRVENKIHIKAWDRWSDSAAELYPEWNCESKPGSLEEIIALLE